MTALQAPIRTEGHIARSVPKSVPKKITEAVYWEKYYDYYEEDVVYEWNDGILEEKPVSNYATMSVYDWFNKLLDHYLRIRPVAKKVLLEMGFRMALPRKIVIRRPDMGIVLHDNPVLLELDDTNYHGIFDVCVEAVSDIEPGAKKRDTVTKKREYARGGVKEYYILYFKNEALAFYRLGEDGTYVPIEPDSDGVIHSEALPGFRFRISDLYRRPSIEEMMEDTVYQDFVMPDYTETKKREKQAGQRAEAEAQRANSEAQRANSAEQRAETEEQRAEAEAQRANSEAQRANSAEQRAETEEQRAEAEAQRANSAEQRAETEEQRAETEARRANSAEQRAETEAQRAETEAQRAKAADAEIARLRVLLEKTKSGI
ncbi:MAG: Uma2 family endonuclease [Gammaproteobacteria bacterium]|nr:Uma2 family endonuclease [Gammaproteobacteria bacterium]